MRSNFFRRPRLARNNQLLLAAAAAVSMQIQARAGSWVDGSSNWNLPGNWSFGVPTAGDFTQIVENDPINRTITYDNNGGFTLSQLQIYNAGFGGTTTLAMSVGRKSLSVGEEDLGGYAFSNNLGAANGGIIQSSSLNSVNTIVIGYNNGDNGFYSLSGGDSSILQASAQEQIGRNGTAVFTQSGGINQFTSQNGAIDIGFDPLSRANYNLSGGTLQFTNSNSAENVGNLGVGTVNNSGGVNFLSDDNLTIGTTASGTGTYNLTSTGSLSVVGIDDATMGDEFIGKSGLGIFNQSGGNHSVASSIIYIGQNAGSTGTYILSDGTLSASNVTIRIGQSGTGAFIQSGGFAFITTGAVYIGNQSAGSLIIANSASFSLQGDMYLGLDSSGNGTASFTGTSRTGISGTLGMAPTSGAIANITLAGNAELDVSSAEIIGEYGFGTFTQSGGSNLPGPSAPVYIGYGEGSSGTYNMIGGILQPNSGIEYIGYNNEQMFSALGTFNQSGGFNLAPNDVDLGELKGGIGIYNFSQVGLLYCSGRENIGDAGTGTFNQTGGSDTGFEGKPGGNFTQVLDIGVQAGAVGTYSLSAGTLTSVSFETVGDSGTGHFVQTGGINSSLGLLTIAFNPGSTGTYSLSAGTLVTAGEIVGGFGTGSFMQSGGINSVNTSSLEVGDGATGVFTMTGGSLSTLFGEYIGDGGIGTFNQSGGTNQNLFGDLNIGPSVAGGTGIYSLSGTGTLIMPNVYVGGTRNTSGTTATFTVSGSASTSISGILKIYAQGRANLDVPNTSVGSLSIVNKGILNLNGALQINFASPAVDPVATIAGYLKSGYNGGTWTGTTGIISTSITGGAPATALGYADGNTDIGTAAGPNQIVVKYTLSGDANLDGLVNFNDLVAVVQNFNKSGADWAHGNFQYGASTNFNDLVAVVQNFNKTLPPPSGSAVTLGPTTLVLGASPSIQSTDVQLPEPAAIALAVVAAGGLLVRRRHSNPSGQSPPTTQT